MDYEQNSKIKAMDGNFEELTSYAHTLSSVAMNGQ